MPITEFTDAVRIEGSQDTVQLSVQANDPQITSIQTWLDADEQPLVQITGDGRIAMGDDLGFITHDALIEAHRDIDSSRPIRSFHALGRVIGIMQHAVQWVVHELEILGESVLSGLQTTLRVRLRHQSTGDSRDADLVATDIEAFNETGTPTEKLGQITGLRSTVLNGSTGYINTAVGVDIHLQSENHHMAINTAYGIRLNDIEGAIQGYALHTGKGITHLGDVLELTPQDPSSFPANGNIWIYPKSDGRLYVRDASGSENVIGEGEGGGNSYGIRSHEINETVSIDEGQQAIWADAINLMDITGEIELETHGSAFYII